ncbi:MAG: GNAT family N-acetyltransferase [Candidatus Coatesbacteria bacterium]|nr:GNAT family N-acetyltransferase [Candidatus Coatesbacteria bacterium]
MGIIIRQYTDADAAGVAKMWNESNEGWPGGFLPFIDYTAERIREKMRENDLIGLFLALDGDEVVGYCSLAERSNDRNAAYIPLLNAHPRCRGKKVGKMAILAAVNECINRGFDRLDLHTWAGNTLAVPLYKKVGFFWAPDTDVQMQNFMPSVFQNPIAKRFFEKHDWYATQVRDLSVKQDEMSWQDRDAYLYEWRDGDDFLKIVIDRHCGGLSCIETPELQVSSRLDVRKPAIGMTHHLELRFTNRVSRPMKVSLRTFGDEGLDTALQSRFDLVDEHLLEADVKVSPDYKLRESHETAPGVKTDLVIDGESFSLKTGIRAKYAIDLIRAPEFALTAPGSSRRVQISLRNQIDSTIEGSLRLLTPAGVDVKPDRKAVKLEASETEGFDVEITAAGKGMHVLRPVFELKGRKQESLLPLKPFATACSEYGDVVGSVFGDQAIIQNEFLKLWGTPAKGWLNLSNAHESLPVAWLWHDQLGEPFSLEFRRLRFAVSMEESDGAKTLVMRNKSEAFPGLEYEKRLTIGTGPLMKFEYRMRNLGAKKKALRLMVSSFLSDAKRKNAIPLKSGLIKVHPTEFPGWDMDVPSKPDEYAETWSAFEREGGSVIGLIWKDATKVDFGGRKMPVLIFDFGDLPALGMKAIQPLYMYVGPGSADSIRRTWARLYQTKPDNELRVEDSVIKFEALQAPIFMDGDAHNVTLKLSHLRNAKANGSMTLEFSGGKVKPQRHTFKDISMKSPFEVSVDVTAKGKARVLPLEATIETLTSVERRTLPVFYAESSGIDEKVQVKALPKEAGKKAIGVDNGVLSFVVSPEFAGAMVSLKRNGREFINSSFPQARAFSWFNPWHGGIRAAVRRHADEIWETSEDMVKVSFEHKTIEREDICGHKWRGVRIVGDMVREALKGLALQVDYLTRPGSNIVVVLPRVLNPTGAFARAWLSLECFPKIPPEKSIVTHYSMDGKWCSSRTSESSSDMYHDGILCAEHVENGNCLTLVAGDSGGNNVLLGLGTDGHSYFQFESLHIDPDSNAGIMWAIAVTETAAEAFLCRDLKDLKFKE